ncbi:DUF5103 domain-containing protein [Prevotella sp. KH2C16]|uniref:type IX secretion system plug protein n=1 Tax=Prevotella sp. KH2C16 TaxID=1855325 RepID=UPI0008EDEB5A|nr:DUF5103 domain-containing protein [Prevotella sp. KH2C16]SFG10915.1 protein of unknown function [Prevotella sp. KH2C16]
MLKKPFFIIGFIMLALNVHAQRQQILADNIRSLQVVAGNRWRDLPVVGLSNGETVSISFDDMTHEYRRFTYSIRHCEADWTESRELFQSDFCEGFAEGNTIDDFEESFNTNTLYTHYTLQIPNDRCRLKMSGNYEVTVYDGNNGELPVAKVYFMVLEPLMGVSLRMQTNTDADINGRHQQISMDVNYGDIKVSDPVRQIKTVLLQNGRWDNCKVNVSPQYTMNDGLRWEHCRDYIFDGGNEYRKFEMLDASHTTMGLEKMDWDGRQYHAYTWTDEPRPSYIYDEAAKGAFLVRNSDNQENDTESEYLYVHFRLKSPRTAGRIYLNGNWTYGLFTPEYEMLWNDGHQQYEATVLLKQGYYSYQYLLLRTDGTTAPLQSEGNFYQTRNEYQALIYYRGIGERTDRLVGYAAILDR